MRNRRIKNYRCDILAWLNFNLLILHVLCDLTFYHYLIKILLLSLGILKSFPIFAVLFVDTLSKQRLANVIRTFKT